VLLVLYVFVLCRVSNVGCGFGYSTIVSSYVHPQFQWLRVRVRVMVSSSIFNNISVISWWLVLLVEETRVSGENHRPAVSQWETLSHNVVSSTSRHEQCIRHHDSNPYPKPLKLGVNVRRVNRRKTRTTTNIGHTTQNA
jgi:hypothetical protein